MSQSDRTLEHLKKHGSIRIDFWDGLERVQEA
jgi:hypothetical protein